MSSLGKILQDAREAKNLSYEQINQVLRIKRCYIEALEDENFTLFPSIPMLRGFIRNYAGYLGLDPAEVLALYDNRRAGSKRRRAKQPKSISSVEIPMARPRSLINADLLITFLLITALLGSVLFFAYTQYLEPVEAELLSNIGLAAEPQPPQDSAPLTLPTATPLPTDTPTPTPTPTPQNYTGVTLEIVVSERTWIQILVDDVKAFEGFLDPGDERRWDGNKRIAIRAGNSGGVEVYINGQYQGFMGKSGETVDRLWEKVDEPPSDEPPSDELTATPTPST